MKLGVTKKNPVHRQMAGHRYLKKLYSVRQKACMLMKLKAEISYCFQDSFSFSAVVK